MAGRPPDYSRLERVYRLVERRPGQTYWQLAQVMGLRPGIITSLLCTMENHGFLLSEDEKGGLHPFGMARGRMRGR